MKKYLLFILSIYILSALTACTAAPAKSGSIPDYWYGTSMSDEPKTEFRSFEEYAQYTYQDNYRVIPGDEDSVFTNQFDSRTSSSANSGSFSVYKPEDIPSLNPSDIPDVNY